MYEVHVKHAKEQLVREIQDFRAKEKLVTIFLKALQSKDQTPNLLRALRSGEAMESIVERLAGAQPGKMENGASPATSHISAYATSEAKDHYFQHFWTGVTNDSSVVEHLFRLYFSWVHPVSMLFEERQFLESYHRQKRDFCSTGLVDAICALACNLHTPSDDDEDDYGELSTRFADAYRDNFDPLDRSITTIQATAVMFLVELAKGSGRAGAYLKLATGSIMEVASMGRTIPSVVLRTTIQGIRCLNVEWAQATFESPMILSSATYEYCMAHDQFDNSLSDEESWHHYTSSSNSNPCGPSLLATLNSEKLKLMNIIGDVCNMMYGSSSAVITARDILKTYSRFIDWRKNLPPCIAEDKHSQSLPHVISLM